MKNTRYLLGLLFLFIVQFSILNAQWNQSFDSPSDLTVWSGDSDNFVVNEDQQLQLMAPDAGQVLMWRPSTIDADSISIGFYHQMDFAPSDNNKSTIYLAMDSDNLAEASGYYIEIGENGSEDAIDFYYQENGAIELISRATMGAMGTDPSTVRIQVDITSDGLWSVYTNYDGEDFLNLDIEFVDSRFKIKDSQFFGIACKFSASRADLFFYDDMFVKAFEKDLNPPLITEVIVEDPSSILVKFNEPVDLSSVSELTNYSIDNGIGNPVSIMQQDAIGTQFLLKFDNELDPLVSYKLTVSNISDLNENVLETISFDLSFSVQPVLGDLLISEILFDPYTGGEDFLELYNKSTKSLDLDGMIIRNEQRDESKVLSGNIVVAPESYLAIGKDRDFLIQEYKPDPDANIVFGTIPAFNNDEGNVMIINQDGIVLDSFDYDEDMHFQLIDDTEGVSLERSNFDIPSTTRSVWKSASQNVRFATPGYANSANINVETGSENFKVVTETFSPNQDGEDDTMVLSYSVDKTGYVANVFVHDAAGFRIRQLLSSELLSTEGIITWDGVDGDGKVADLGIYIIVGELFHADGNVISFKETVVLADFIK